MCEFGVSKESGRERKREGKESNVYRQVHINFEPRYSIHIDNAILWSFIFQGVRDIALIF